MPTFSKCFRCGEVGRRSYECPKKNTKLLLLKEEQMDEGKERIYDDEP